MSNMNMNHLMFPTKLLFLLNFYSKYLWLMYMIHLYHYKYHHQQHMRQFNNFNLVMFYKKYILQHLNQNKFIMRMNQILSNNKHDKLNYINFQLLSQSILILQHMNQNYYSMHIYHLCQQNLYKDFLQRLKYMNYMMMNIIHYQHLDMLQIMLNILINYFL